jgi:hypothetical protein
MTPLDPRQLSLLRVRAGVFAAALLLAGALADRFLLRGTGLPLGATAGAAALLALAIVLILPPRRYHSWGYRMDEDELHLRHGVWMRVRTVVPLGRVQHIDVVHGPLQRLFGLGSLVLHTAGTRSSAVLLPGLAGEQAERMRDHIRGRIREDLG